MECDEEELKATKSKRISKLEQHIKNLKDYIRIDKENIAYDDSDFAQFCKGHCEDIQVVLDYIEKLEKELEDRR